MITLHTQGNCATCGAKSGERCIVTLYPAAGPLSIGWHHAARERSTAA